MASSSPALSNNSNETTPTSMNNINSSKNLRGLNKPKCIKCGNVARSRCPYQSCKSCCAKAQNPCHIHVLKGNSTFPDKALSSGSPLFDQQSTDVSPSGNSHRVASLRQLSSTFSQFNNLQPPLRSRKPLTRKDAAIINEWRFSKLKEYKDRNIEAENEAFDRYIQNINLLEEAFCVKSTPESPTQCGSPTSHPNSNSTEDSSEMITAGMKLSLRSNPIRAENFRKRIQYIVDQGLRKIRKTESNDVDSDVSEQDKLAERSKKSKGLSELMDKLNKACNEEDLKSCLEMKSQLFDQHTEGSRVESEDIETTEQQNDKDDSSPKLESDYSPPKWFGKCSIDQEALNSIDAHFSSLEEIENL